MTLRRPALIGTGVACACSMLLLGASGARADAGSDMRADLASVGLPQATVTVSTPPGTTQAFSADAPGDDLPLDSLEPYLSPDPTAPLPVAHVQLTLPSADVLSGLVTTPGLDVTPFTRNVSGVMHAELASMEAIKHVLASGTTVGGLDLTIDDGQQSVRALDGAPDTTTFPVRQTFTTLMSRADVETRLRGGLPQWATQAALTVSDDAAGERCVSLAIRLPAAALHTLRVKDLSDSLDAAQTALSAAGANIGRIEVTVSDLATGDPLYISANDALWAQRSYWYSPLVVGFAPSSIDHAPQNASRRLGAGPLPPG